MGEQPNDRYEPSYAAEETWLGHVPGDSTTAVTLASTHLRRGCYIEGNASEQQTALCQHLLAQWGRAGYGFCYMHPDSFATLDVLRALPDARLDDVVWINLRPRRLADHLDIPAEERIAIDPIECEPDHLTPDVCVTAPCEARVGDYLDVLAHDGPATDWNLGSLIAALLDQAVADAATNNMDLTQSLTSATYTATFTDEDGSSGLHDWVSEQAAPAWYGGIRRAARLDGEVFETAQMLLGEATLQGEGLAPLRNTTSCSVHDCVHEDAIILVTGDLPPADAQGGVNRMFRLATRLLATVVLRRVWEGVQSAAAAHDTQAPLYPVVLDDVTRLFAHEPRLLTELLTRGTTTETGLALVCAGRSTSRFGSTVQAAIAESIATRVVVEDRASDDVARMLRTDTEIMERVFEAAQQGDVGPAPRCWVKRDAAGILATPEDLGGFAPFTPLGPPPATQSLTAAEDAIARSQTRHGTAHPMAEVFDL